MGRNGSKIGVSDTKSHSLSMKMVIFTSAFDKNFTFDKFCHETGLEQRWWGLTAAKFHEISSRVFLDT